MPNVKEIWWKTMFGEYRSGELIRKVYCRKAENYCVVRASNGIVRVMASDLIHKIHKIHKPTGPQLPPEIARINLH